MVECRWRDTNSPFTFTNNWHSNRKYAGVQGFHVPATLGDLPMSNMQELNICHKISAYKSLTHHTPLNHTHSRPFLPQPLLTVTKRPALSHIPQPTWLLAIKRKKIYTLAVTLFNFMDANPLLKCDLTNVLLSEKSQNHTEITSLRCIRQVQTCWVKPSSTSLSSSLTSNHKGRLLHPNEQNVSHINLQTARQNWLESVITPVSHRTLTHLLFMR